MKIIVPNWDDPAEVREVSDADAKLYGKSYVFEPAARDEILAVVKERARLKKIYNDSMTLVYELCNKLTREGRR